MRAGLLVQLYTARTRCGHLPYPSALRPTRSALLKLKMPDMIELSTRDRSGKVGHSHPPLPPPLPHPPTPGNSAQALHGHGHEHVHAHGVLGHSHAHGEEDGHGLELIETLEAGGAFNTSRLYSMICSYKKEQETKDSE